MVNKLKDAIYGLAIGDALGVPYEFQPRGSFNCTDMIGYGTHNQPEGTWSDDTSMTLATCMSIKNRKIIDCNDIRHEFENWLFANKYTPFGKVFDCGRTCGDAIYDKVGKDDEWSNGNGSLMRILPLAFVNGVLNQDIENVSAITHAHKVSKTICVKYVRIAKSLLNDIDIRNAIEKETSKDFLETLETMDEKSIISGGYVVDTFTAALWCLIKTNSYKDCVLKAVNLGADTDTTSAVAGGLAGIVYGYNSMPIEWINKLQRKDIINRCLW